MGAEINSGRGRSACSWAADRPAPRAGDAPSHVSRLNGVGRRVRGRPPPEVGVGGGSARNRRLFAVCTFPAGRCVGVRSRGRRPRGCQRPERLLVAPQQALAPPRAGPSPPHPHPDSERRRVQAAVGRVLAAPHSAADEGLGVQADSPVLRQGRGSARTSRPDSSLPCVPVLPYPHSQVVTLEGRTPGKVVVGSDFLGVTPRQLHSQAPLGMTTKSRAGPASTPLLRTG